MKLQGLVGMIVHTAHTAHTTQQNSLIGSSSKVKIFHYDADVENSLPIWFLPTRFSPCMPLTHLYICHASHILWKNLHTYNIKGTVQQEKEHKQQGACQALGIV